MIFLFLSRTVANRFTRLTCDLITGACPAGCWGMAGMANATATVAVTPCIRSLCIERMYYTFLGERCPAGKTPRGYCCPVGCREAVRWMRGRNHPRGYFQYEVWPEDYEKSTKNSVDGRHIAPCSPTPWT